MAGMLSSSRVERALLALGFVLVSTRGSHKKFRAPTGGTVVLPLGHSQILDSYVKKACVLGGVDWREFLDRY
jgi:predicted RNA binding protein YcfA (HicA-like mRNA interferase family)